jgi:hypothetical protein
LEGVRSFADEEGAKQASSSKLFESDKAREELESKYNFAEQDVEFFGAKLQNKSERDSIRGTKGKKDEEADEEEKSYAESKVKD